MATVAAPGMVMINGRLGDIQVAQDAGDIEITPPAGATHVEIHQLANQQFYYSWTGLANSWLTLSQRPTQDAPFKMQVDGVKLYLRKAYNPRLYQERPDLVATLGVAKANADDRILNLMVTFTKD